MHYNLYKHGKGLMKTLSSVLFQSLFWLSLLMITLINCKKGHVSPGQLCSAPMTRKSKRH